MTSYPPSSYQPPSNPPPAPSSGVPWKWVLGCTAVVMVIGGAVMAALVALIVYFNGEPEGLLIEVDYPWKVAVGEQFDVTFHLRNVGEQPFEVGDIDLDEALEGSFLDGCVVLSTTPKMEKDYSIQGLKSFHYNRTIPPGESHTVVFRVEAQSEGQWGGSVGVYVEDLAARKNVDILVSGTADQPLEKLEN